MSACEIFILSTLLLVSAAESSTADSFPLMTQFSSVELDMSDGGANSCPTEHQRSIAREHITAGIMSELVGIPEQLIECDKYHIGKVPHCSVSNCSVLFDQLAMDSGMILFSGFYWLQLPDRAPERVYCNRETGYPEVPSCPLLFSYHPTAQSGYYRLLLRDGVSSEVYCNSETGLPEPESCGHAHQLELKSGYYTLRPSQSEPPLNDTVFCDMDLEVCGSEGGWWTRVVSLDINSTVSCPDSWDLITAPIRACSRSASIEEGCSSVRFSSQGHNYSRVCGRVIAHQRGRGFGFWPLLGRNQGNPDGNYVTGVSITHGDTPRKHIWSFAANLGNNFCPCTSEYAGTSEILMGNDSFVGNHFFCETGRQGFEPGKGEFDLANPLWDGATCPEQDTCCRYNNPPWFSVALDNPTGDDVEVRICGLNPVSESGTPISLLDIYIH